jgi:hypothetical protein
MFKRSDFDASTPGAPAFTHKCSCCGQDDSWADEPAMWPWSVSSTVFEKFKLVWCDQPADGARKKTGTNCHFECLSCGHMARDDEEAVESEQRWVVTKVKCSNRECGQVWEEGLLSNVSEN